MAAPTFSLASSCKCLTLPLKAKAASHDRTRRRSFCAHDISRSAYAYQTHTSRYPRGATPSFARLEERRPPLAKEIAPAMKSVDVHVPDPHSIRRCDRAPGPAPRKLARYCACTYYVLKPPIIVRCWIRPWYLSLLQQYSPCCARC